MGKTYSVNLWGSDPALDNDDCWTGADFATRKEAEVAYKNPTPHFYAGAMGKVVFVELDGPDVNAKRRVAADRKPVRDLTWRNEMAMEAGMLYGCDGYNEVMGY